jgi:hypothetical protein
METIWLLIALTLSPDKHRPQDLTGDITVSYHDSLDKCRTKAIKFNERFESKLKAHGIKQKYDATLKEAGLVNMEICWNGMDAQIAHMKNTINSPWLGVVSRFTPIAYVDKNTGERGKVGTGIARMGRFKTFVNCREALSEPSTVLARTIKPGEDQAVFCVRTNRD